jgi:L-ribulose-5-phosphate 3-epimerase
MKISRRRFIRNSIITTGVLGSALTSGRASQATDYLLPYNDFKINIFSKHLHWLNYSDMASAAADLGFDGVDLTVRPDGHVLPGRVKTDLPKAVEAIRKAGLDVYMITTSITDAGDPLTEDILRTASGLGISTYRLGWIKYANDKSIEQNLSDFKEQFKKLAALNKQYNIHGGYQNHSGTNLGSPVWDLWNVLRDLDPHYIGCQYDINHATAEGANSWPLGLQLLKSYIKTIDIKDFNWENKDGKLTKVNRPLGEGIVDFKRFFSLLQEYKIKCPIAIHYEYPLGGAESGARTITISKDEVITSMKKDLHTLKSWLISPATK